MDVVHARVSRRGYVYRAVSLPVGQIVRLTKEQLDGAQQTQPPFFKPATDEEVKAARTIIDLSKVVGPKAKNVSDAEAPPKAPDLGPPRK